MGATLKRRGSGPLSAALVLIALGVFSVLATLVFTGCTQEEDTETDSPTKEGVLTVNGAEDGVFYSADVYSYPDAVTEAAVLNTVISNLAPTGTGTGLAGNGTLEIGLQKPDGAVWMPDGDFLVVLKNANDAIAPLKYKSAVPFTVGSAALEYEEMEAASNSYTVTFHANGGTPSEITLQVLKGGNATPPSPAPTLAGCAIDGWYTSTDYAVKWDFDTDIVTTDIDLYAKWSQNYYKVTFNTGEGGSTVAEQNVAHGNNAMKPFTDPTRPGFSFVNWYTDSSGGTLFDFGTGITADTVVYAGWSQSAPHTVTFYQNDGSGNIHDRKTAPHNGKAVPPAEPKLTSYAFDGWYTSTDYAVKWDFDTNLVTTDVDLYAKWSQIYYKVTFNTGEGGSIVDEQNVTYGSKATMPVPDPTRTGYAIDGWYTSTDYAVKWDFDTDLFTDIDLYAKWLKSHYVTFYTGEDGSPVAQQNVVRGSKASSPTPTRTGYAFDGWYTSTDYAVKWNFDTDIFTDIDLYAKWTQIYYKVMFNTGTNGSAVAQQNVTYGIKATRPDADPTRPGFTFIDWHTTSGGTTLFNFDTGITADTVIYAGWSQNYYKVTFNTGTGGSAVAEQSVTYGIRATRPANPTRTGYAFDGWYTTSGGTTLFNFDTGIIADITLYAKWSPLTFAVLIADMAATANSTSANYTLPSGNEGYNGPSELTTANCPASVTINGGGRLISGNVNIVVGTGVTLTLTNITFYGIKFTVEGTLVLGTGVVISGNVGARVSVCYGGEFEMRAGAQISQGNEGGVVLGPWGSGSVPPKFTMKGGKISGATVNGGVYMLAPNSVFTMSGGEISGNSGTAGGGVTMKGQGCVFTMTGGTIWGNSGVSGGGAAMEGPVCVFTMSGSAAISNNQVWTGGGVSITRGGTFTMNGGVIQNNISDNYGGGVFIYTGGGVFNMTSGKISWNKSGSDGGGVHIYNDLNATFTMSGGLISDNEAQYNGGGVYIHAGNTFNMTGGEIIGNDAGGWEGTPGIGVVAPSIGGNPWIGANKERGAGPGWICNNTDVDVSP